MEQNAARASGGLVGSVHRRASGLPTVPARAEQRSGDLVGQLEETERRRLDALVKADMGTAEALHADDYQLVTPRGDHFEG
jgi:hypothetical protein